MEKQFEKFYKLLRIPLLFLLLISFIRFGLLPGWKQANSDFPNYYVSAQLLQNGKLQEAYDIEKFNVYIHQVNTHASGLFVMYPPPTAWLMYALAGFDLLVAKRIWLLLSMCMLIGIIAFFARIASIPFINAAISIFLCGFNLYNDIMLGQVYVMMLLLLMLAIYAWNSQHYLIVGMSWGFVSALKFLPLFFIPLLLYKKHFRVLGYMLIVFILIHSITLSISGSTVYKSFFTAFQQNFLGGQVANEVPMSIQYQSIQVIINRLLLQGSISFYMGSIISILWKFIWILMAFYACLKTRYHSQFIAVSCASLILLLLLFENGSATYHLLLAVPTLLSVYKLDIPFLTRATIFLTFAAMGFIPFVIHVLQVHSFLTDYSRLWCLCLFAGCYFYALIRINHHKAASCGKVYHKNSPI